MGNNENEDPLEAEFPRSRILKNPTSREKQEHEDSVRAVYRSCVLLVSKVEELVDDFEIEVLDEEEREITTPTVSFDHGFMTQQNADVSNSYLSRQHGLSNGSNMLSTEKVPQHISFQFLLVSSKIWVFC